MADRFKICFLVLIGKLLSSFSRTFNLGHGSTWPGHIALKFFPDILSFYSGQLRQGLILLAGTNGKTTTAKMTRTILEKKDFTVIHNESGANLLNGLTSVFLLASNWQGRITADYAIFEVDEATLPLAINNILQRVSSVSFRPSPPWTDEWKNLSHETCFEKDPSTSLGMTVVLLNLFRDQLDRYGEVDIIARKWKGALSQLPSESTVILNADDPQIAQLGSATKAKVLYFGIDDSRKFLRKKEHATDSVYCPSCGYKLNYQGVYYSHLGVWFCPKCGITRPQPNLSHWQQPVPGLYNLYNTLAAVLTCQSIGILDEEIEDALIDFQPAFGRQEEFKEDGKTVKVFLAKNPVGANEAIRTIIEMRNEKLEMRMQKKLTVVLALNDNIPDGRDVSWIWDVEFEELIPHCKKIICSGKRFYDMGVRIKYACSEQLNNLVVEQDLDKAIRLALENIKDKETLYILPTYSAMLEVRKILSGRKIL